MCCIFTFCGWMIDLAQRLWTFTMSCCISSAVCCLMMTSSMSGIALGYNYSLAEYIDLKETNVSVYIKRGIFDDEIVDDMDWRRSGRMPVAGHIGSDNLMTPAPADDDRNSIKSGRRLDDSLIESDDPNKYEGSLMKLTAQAPFPGTTTGTSEGPEYVEAPEKKFADGSLDQLKAIQGMVDARKSALKKADNNGRQSTYADIDERYLAQLPINNLNRPPQGRRMLGGNDQAPSLVDRLNPARFAVPPSNIGALENWVLPKYADHSRRLFSEIDNAHYPVYMPPTYPKPIRLNTGPLRPTDPEPPPVMRTNRPDKDDIEQQRVPYRSSPPVMGAERLKEKMLLDKYEAPLREFPKKSDESSEDYEDNIKGLPVRRRRSIEENDTPENAIKYKEESTEDNNNNLEIGTQNPLETVYIDVYRTINNEDISNRNEHCTLSYEGIETTAQQQSVEQLNEKLKLTNQKIISKQSIQNKLLANPIGTLNPKSSEKLSNNDDKVNIMFQIWNWVFGNELPSKVNDVGLVKYHMTQATPKTLSPFVSVNDITPMSSIIVRILQSTVV